MLLSDIRIGDYKYVLINRDKHEKIDAISNAHYWEFSAKQLM